jgi:thioredoxin reductase
MEHQELTGAAILGCGPAGIAAAIQIKRSGLSCLVFERGRIGGLLVNANLVENYPGFAAGISGIDLAGLMKEHLEAHCVDVIPEEVSGLKYEEDGFTLRAGDKTFRSRVAVLATGTRAKSPEGVAILPAARPLVLHEIASILDVREEHIAVVGAGDAAFDYALNLGRRNHVTILNRTKRVRCLGILRERVESRGSIEYISETGVVEVADGPRGGLSILCRSKGRDRKIEADRLVFAIGREPELDLLSGWPPELRDRLSRQGLLHMVGDVRMGRSRQTAIAVGDGTKAAMDICRKLGVQGR